MHSFLKSLWFGSSVDSDGGDKTAIHEHVRRTKSAPASTATPEAELAEGAQYQNKKQNGNAIRSNISAVSIGYLPEMDHESLILTQDDRRELQLVLPPKAYASVVWMLVFSTDVSGFSLLHFFRVAANVPFDSPMLIVIKTTEGARFGAYVSETLKPSNSWYGDGTVFVFVLEDGPKKFESFHWTSDGGGQDLFVYGHPTEFRIGSSEGHSAISLFGDLSRGRTQACETFGSPALGQHEDFQVESFEAWALR